MRGFIWIDMGIQGMCDYAGIGVYEFGYLMVYLDLGG